MARVLGVELVTLLVLGFVIGMLSFMLWNIKRELLALQGDNESLSKRMLGLASETSTFRYKKTLVESDLEKLRRDMAAKEEQVTGLTGQLAALKVQVVGMCATCAFSDSYVQAFPWDYPTCVLVGDSAVNPMCVQLFLNAIYQWPAHS